MRDIDLIHVPAVGPPADPVDNAYLQPSPGGILSTTTMHDPSGAPGDTKAYTKVSLGGEFGPARAALLDQPADGGVANLAAAAVVTVTPPVVPTPPNPMALGRAANNTSFLNLYPWHKTPPEGLDQNNPNPPPAPPPPPSPPAHGITMPVLQLAGHDGTVQFSGPAAANATVVVYFALDNGPTQMVSVSVLAGDTASQIAAKVRSAVDATFGIDADGTGGTVHVVGLGGNLTYFTVTIS